MVRDIPAPDAYSLATPPGGSPLADSALRTPGVPLLLKTMQARKTRWTFLRARHETDFRFLEVMTIIYEIT